MQKQATDQWLETLIVKARKGLEAGVESDPKVALQVLERLDARLAPPRQRIDIGALNYAEMTDDALEAIAAGIDPAVVLASGRGRP